MWKRALLTILLSQTLAEAKLHYENSTLDGVNELSLLLNKVMQSFYCEKSAVDLITIDSNCTEARQILSEIIPTVGKCAPIRISSIVKGSRGKKANNIAVIKDENGFLQFLKDISSETFDFRGFYTLVVIDTDVNLQTIFANAWRNSISNINAIVKSRTSNYWRIFTYHPFFNGICGNSAPIEIDASHLFQEKITNLQQCPLKFPKLNYYPGLIIRELPNGQTSIAGIDGDIMTELMSSFNFTVTILRMPIEEERWGVANDSGNHTGAIRMVVEREADFMLGLMALTLLRVKFMDSTTSFISFPFVLIVPRGMEFSPFQKLFRPFNFIVWSLLVLSFLCGFTVIFLLRRFGSETLKKKLFVESHRVPYLNMMNVFFGGTLHVLPSRSVARMLLATFILYCLVMRTIYQGLLFKFLQAEDRQPPVMTVDDLMEKDFDVYMQPVYVEHSKHMKFFSRRKVIRDSQVEHFQQQTLDANFKGAVTSSLDEVLYLNMLHHKNFTYRVLPEYIYSFNTVIYFQKHSPYLKAFNEKISMFKSAGLIDYWVSKYLNAAYLNVPEAALGPRKLNLMKLQGGFELWLLGCGVSFAVFVLEVVFGRIFAKK